MLKSERVLISESIEATPINHATYVRARISWRYSSSYDRSDEAVAVKKTSSQLHSWCVYHPHSLIYSLQGYLNKECLFASKKDGSAMGAYLSVGA